MAATESLKKLLPAGKNDDLDVSGCHIENVKHAAHPPIIRKHKGVIQHDRSRVPLFDKHFCECQANQNGDLLLGSHAQVIEGLLIPGLSDHTGNVKVFIDRNVSTGKQEL